MRGKARTGRKVGAYASLNEERYAQHLEAKRKAGTIDRWDYEPETFKLADGLRYTPDFRVILPDGLVEFHETKACKEKRGQEPQPLMTEAGRVKIRVFPALHPYPLFICYQMRCGTWVIEDA